MNPRIQKVSDEIDKMRAKIFDYQQKLKELERLKIELENGDIIALIRGVDIPPDQFAEFVRMFKERENGTISNNINQKTENKEDALIEE